MENFLTISETARLLGVCENTLRDWDDNGKFPANRTAGGHRRYTIESIREYLDKQAPQERKEEPPSQNASFVRGNPKNKIKEILKNWEGSEFLEGVPKEEQETLAVLLENTNLLLAIIRDVSKVPWTNFQYFELLKNIWINMKLKSLIRIVPMLGPVELIFYKKLVKNNSGDFNLFIDSAPVVATTKLCPFNIFLEADFHHMKDIYAKAFANTFDEDIFDILYETKKTDLETLSNFNPSKICDYIVAPKKYLEEITTDGIDLIEGPLKLDEKSFIPKAIMGKYEDLTLTLPVWCPYTLLGTFSPGPYHKPMYRSGYLLNQT